MSYQRNEAIFNNSIAALPIHAHIEKPIGLESPQLTPASRVIDIMAFYQHLQTMTPTQRFDQLRTTPPETLMAVYQTIGNLPYPGEFNHGEGVRRAVDIEGQAVATEYLMEQFGIPSDNYQMSVEISFLMDWSANRLSIPGKSRLETATHYRDQARTNGMPEALINFLIGFDALEMIPTLQNNTPWAFNFPFFLTFLPEVRHHFGTEGYGESIGLTQLNEGLAQSLAQYIHPADRHNSLIGSTMLNSFNTDATLLQLWYAGLMAAPIDDVLNKHNDYVILNHFIRSILSAASWFSREHPERVKGLDK